MMSIHHKINRWILPPIYAAIFIPRTWFRLIQEFLLKNEKADDLITAMGRDGRAITSPWYMKTARMVEQYGRTGYYFEEALGMPFRGRFWFDIWATRLFNTLKYRRFTRLVLAALFLQICLLFLANPAINSFVFLILLIPSPLFIRSLITYGKPELLAWGLYPLLLWSLLTGMPIYGWIALVISLLNYTVSLFVLGILILAIVLGMVSFWGWLWLLPLLFLQMYRLNPFFTHFGPQWLFENIQGTGKGVTQDAPKKVYGAYHSLFFGLVLISFLLHSVTAGEPLILIAGFLVVAAHVVNNRFVRYADNSIFYRLYLLTSVPLLLLYPHWLPQAVMLLISYFFLSYGQLVEKDHRYLPMENFPNIESINLKTLYQQTMQKFSFCKTGDRLGLEVSGLSKFYGGYRVILGFWEYCLNPGGVEFIPSEWFRSTASKYLVDTYQRFNSSMTESEVKAVCRQLGLSYILAHTDEFRANLTAWNFEVVGTYEADIWKAYGVRDLFRSENDITIHMVNLDDCALISPPVKMVREGNSIRLNVTAGCAYTLKYNYYKGWRSSNQQLKLYPVESGGLTFLGLVSEIDGEVELEYHFAG